MNQTTRPFPTGAMTFGLGVCATFTLIMFTWLATAPLNSAVIAGGVVAVESYRKVVQHLEGGIVNEIHVKNGDRVAAGDVLISLRSVATASEVDRLETQYFETLANVARLSAERDGAERIAFPAVLVESDVGAAKAAMSGQEKIFESRLVLQRETLSVVEKKIEQLVEEKKGLRGQLASNDEQATLLAEERQDIEQLLDKKLLRKSRFLDLKRRQAQLEGEKSKLTAKIAEIEQEILELELRKQEARSSTLVAVTQELKAQQAQSYELSRALDAARDVLSRTKVRAPISGIVVDLQAHTRDGVVAPRQTLMEIVPASDSLIVEARVHPDDIESVGAGLKAHVVLTTLTRRYGSGVPGKVESVSADRLIDEATGQAYYLVRVNIDKAAAVAQDLKVMAGMGADVFIETGERTPLDIIAGPIVKTFRYGMRDR